MSWNPEDLAAALGDLESIGRLRRPRQDQWGTRPCLAYTWSRVRTTNRGAPGLAFELLSQSGSASRRFAERGPEEC